MEDLAYQKIKDLYLIHKNIWKVGEILGISGQKVHNNLTMRGDIVKMNYFTEDDKIELKEKYKLFRDIGNLKSLAKDMGRTVPFIVRKAKELGLTCKESRISMKPFAKAISENTKRWISEKGHPKGMEGKTHSQEVKDNMSIRAKANWADPNSKLNSKEHRQKLSDNMSKNQANGVLKNNYSRAKSGVVKIGGKSHFYRSEWESNIAAYFQFLKINKEIKEWEYEPHVFWFEKIKRGVRSYKPDFRITENSGDIFYVEVKGWMDKKSVTKLNRMRIYHPDVKIQLLGSDRYKEISKRKALIPNWGDMSNGNKVEEIKCVIETCDNKSHSNGYCRKHYYKIHKL